MRSLFFSLTNPRSPVLRRGAAVPGIALATLLASAAGASAVDFNHDIRPLLSNNCFQCHGPDEAQRQGGSAGLRLDVSDGDDGAYADLGGYAAIVPGKPEESEVVLRITSSDPALAMPPAEIGKKLSQREKDLLSEWIREGAPYARHWSYVPPTRPALPAVAHADWPRTDIDRFVLARLERESLLPSPEADRTALIRRATLDLTGLPPSLEEVRAFVEDVRPDAYERMVDRCLASDAYGEHLARMWLDLARYADSAGYADDPPRTIWGYRDYVIRAFNRNLPFDQFTVEQIAGDLLPHPTDDQLIATAFHRNTLTNNEGGTNDEEFRNVAIVDRVNTTLAAWMGTTIACAQCHTHKFDPISQTEYFRLFAIFNNTADADLKDESPLLERFSEDQLQRKGALEVEIAQQKNTLAHPPEEVVLAQQAWETRLAGELKWTVLRAVSADARTEAGLRVESDGTISAETATDTNVYHMTWQAPFDVACAAIRLETFPVETLPNQGSGFGEGNFVVTGVHASLSPPAPTPRSGRYVRVELPGRKKYLSLAEVQVFQGRENVAPRGTASQISTRFDGQAERAIDGNTDGDFARSNSVTHTEAADDPWWEVDLGAVVPVDRIVAWNRMDRGVEDRLSNFRVLLLDEERRPVWEQSVEEIPRPSRELSVSGAVGVPFSTALADYAQPDFPPAAVLDAAKADQTGWAIGGALSAPHALTLVAARSVPIPAGWRLSISIDQLSPQQDHTLARFRLSLSEDERAADYGAIPADVLAALKSPADARGAAEQSRLTEYYRSIEPILSAEREKLASLQQQVKALEPYLSVPVMRELPEESRRTTQIQRRGNYLDAGDEVQPGVPSAFNELPADVPVDRLALARWLVSRDNPLTARVTVNRLWEKLYGDGLVRTSEEFGAQGEAPSHPELLDWLAVEFMDGGWDTKALLRLLVTSAVYRQSSQVTPELLQRDPANTLLARGPRVRLTAETIRDQTLAVSGLLSPKMYGPPVRPPQPEMGLKAAFGSGIDWQTSAGEDRYRRGLYTMWRRSNPYPSMAAFDAPNREVCTVRRDRTNTPLQALVTLNDPVYVEAAQALARRIHAFEGGAAAKARFGFESCLSRPPQPAEAKRLVQLYEAAHQRFAAEPEQALALATQPLGPVPAGADVAELAAWTTVGNVLLNLDEFFMKR